MKILAIDPGTKESGYCIIDSTSKRPLKFGKALNEALRNWIAEGKTEVDGAVIEMIASYGMPVGREVFETCIWIGVFSEDLRIKGIKCDFIYRSEEKMHICQNSKANDSNIRRALIDRFAEHDHKTGKGTVRNKDFFFGFKADVWQAYAVGITYIETKLEEID